MNRASPDARAAIREERRSPKWPKLSPQQIARVRKLYGEGDVTFAELARQFGVGGELIAKLVRGSEGP